MEMSCSNGKDDDCDGKLDCNDPDCRKPGSCGCTPNEVKCHDGVDEDCDGDSDCADRDCQQCVPGTKRWCDDPKYCHWGKQTCGPDGKWGACIETNDGPGGCTGKFYSVSCCISAGKCCQNFPTNNASVGNCAGIVECK
jgi:hypothetical protein